MRSLALAFTKPFHDLRLWLARRRWTYNAEKRHA